MKSILELAKIIKERDNPDTPTLLYGEVVGEFPDIQIRLGEKILLTQKELHFSSYLNPQILRNTSLTVNADTVECSTASVGDHGAHHHIIGNKTLKGTQTFDSVLKIGDKVILLPFFNYQEYYVLDKVVK